MWPLNSTEGGGGEEFFCGFPLENLMYFILILAPSLEIWLLLWAQNVDNFKLLRFFVKKNTFFRSLTIDMRKAIYKLNLVTEIYRKSSIRTDRTVNRNGFFLNVLVAHFRRFPHYKMFLNELPNLYKCCNNNVQDDWMGRVFIFYIGHFGMWP